MLKKLRVRVRSFIDRKYQLAFHREQCTRIVLFGLIYDYNDLVTADKSSVTLRHLGKSWFKILPKQEKSPD